VGPSRSVIPIGFIDAHRHRWPVAVMCRVIEFSEGTSYAPGGSTSSDLVLDALGVKPVRPGQFHR
jgi:hypothetical protein